MDRIKSAWRFTRRWTFRVLAITWLALVVFLAWLWPHSHTSSETLTRDRSYRGGRASGQSWVQLAGDAGIARLTVTTSRSDRFSTSLWLAGGGWDRVRWYRTRGAPTDWTQFAYRTWWEAAGFTFGYRSYGDVSRGIDLRASAPMWAVELALTVPTIVTFAIWRRWSLRRQRIAGGLCRSCGYDLRASTERCPECGTLIAPSVSVAS